MDGDELLADILEFHDYPIRRFPIALWTRMKYELENYLVISYSQIPKLFQSESKRL